MDVRPRVSGRYDRQARLRAHLDGFHGILQVDGYAGYRALAETGHVQLAFCWSHVRRPFYEIAAGGDAPIATEALRRIADLYAIETEIRGRSADGRRNVRQDRTKPLVEALKTWMEVKLAAVSQKGKVAAAIRYALSRWVGLSRFLDDGHIEIDSNVVERAIRPLALNRKNALLRVRTAAASIGRSTPRSSRPANSTASIRKPISPTSSPASSKVTRSIVSTNCFRGTGPWLTRPEGPRNIAYDQFTDLTAHARPPQTA